MSASTTVIAGCWKKIRPSETSHQQILTANKEDPDWKDHPFVGLNARHDFTRHGLSARQGLSAREGP